MYGVVTKISEGDGNKCDRSIEPNELRWDLMRGYKWINIPEKSLIFFRQNVFELGEILILDRDSEREIGGRGRKPSGWDIEFEKFKNVTDAIKKSLEVLDEVKK